MIDAYFPIFNIGLYNYLRYIFCKCLKIFTHKENNKIYKKVCILSYSEEKEYYFSFVIVTTLI